MKAPCCGTCAFFKDAPDGLERGLPGLTSFGSAYASTRAGDGVCGRHQRHVTETSRCDHHKAD